MSRGAAWGTSVLSSKDEDVLLKYVGQPLTANDLDPSVVDQPGQRWQQRLLPPAGTGVARGAHVDYVSEPLGELVLDDAVTMTAVANKARLVEQALRTLLQPQDTRDTAYLALCSLLSRDALSSRDPEASHPAATTWKTQIRALQSSLDALPLAEWMRRLQDTNRHRHAAAGDDLLVDSIDLCVPTAVVYLRPNLYGYVWFSLLPERHPLSSEYDRRTPVKIIGSSVWTALDGGRKL